MYHTHILYVLGIVLNQTWYHGNIMNIQDKCRVSMSVRLIRLLLKQMKGCFPMPIFSGMWKVTDTVRLCERLRFHFVKWWWGWNRQAVCHSAYSANKIPCECTQAPPYWDTLYYKVTLLRLLYCREGSYLFPLWPKLLDVPLRYFKMQSDDSVTQGQEYCYE